MPNVNMEQMKGTYRTREMTRGKLLKQGLRLEYLSLGWNAIAGTGAVITGL